MNLYVYAYEGEVLGAPVIYVVRPRGDRLRLMTQCCLLEAEPPVSSMGAPSDSRSSVYVNIGFSGGNCVWF